MVDNRQGAPVPRDYDRASFSEIVAFRSKKIRILRSPVFYIFMFMAFANVILFSLLETYIYGADKDRYHYFIILEWMSIGSLVILILAIIHLYSKTDKSILYYVFPICFIFAGFFTPFWHYYRIPFDMLAGSEIGLSGHSFAQNFWAAFAGPGLREELYKAIPTLFCALLTIRADMFGAWPRPLFNLLRVRTPLDGMLMATAAGAAFILFETGYQYIPQSADTIFSQLKDKNAVSAMDAMSSAFILLVPRVLNGFVGHVAWASIFGYFIGLAVIRPRSALLLIAIGYVCAAALHGLWDTPLSETVGNSPFPEKARVALSVVGAFLAVTCLVKARQIEASLYGRSTETQGSIIVGAPAAAPYGVAPAQYALSPAPFVAPPPPQAETWPKVSELALRLDGVTKPLRAGEIVDLGQEPSLGGRGAGTRAEVMRHPTKADVIGLKNLGTNTWYARLRDNTIQPVEAQRSLRLAAGMSVDFGAGVVAQIVAS